MQYLNWDNKLIKWRGFVCSACIFSKDRTVCFVFIHLLPLIWSQLYPFSVSWLFYLEVINIMLLWKYKQVKYSLKKSSSWAERRRPLYKWERGAKQCFQFRCNNSEKRKESAAFQTQHCEVRWHVVLGKSEFFLKNDSRLRLFPHYLLFVHILRGLYV